MNEQVEQLVAALKENAKSAEVWNDDPDFIESMVHVKTAENGDVIVSDNYETIAGFIYTIKPDGSWFFRMMYHDMQDKPYSFEKAMADARIMYTG